MQFGQLLKGARAERTVSLKLGDAEVSVIVRPLTALEDTDVCAAAIRYAKGKGGEPRVGDPIYDAALMAHTLSLACLDPDSAPDKREPFFDGGAEQALASLDTDTLSMLYGHQQAWAEECSPSFRQKSLSELVALCDEFAEDTSDPKARVARYLGLSLNTRLTLLHFTASLVKASRVLKLSPSSDSATSTGSAAENKPASPPSANVSNGETA